MSEAEATRPGLRGQRAGGEAVPGQGKRAAPGRSDGGSRRWRGGRRGERPMVPKAEFTSYYGKPVLNAPVWEARDIAGYFFLGGLAGGSSLLAAGADLTGRPELSRVAKTGAAAAITLSLAALVHDLGRPARFVNMMRVFKVTSPMSVGTWLLGGYAPAAGVAAVTALTGRLPRVGSAATAGAALLGPAVAAYTAVLVADTAVPSWHDGYREMPFVFTGSAAMAAGGLGLLAGPARRVRAGPEPGTARRGHGGSRPGADDPPHGDDRRAVPGRPRRRVRASRPDPGRRRVRGSDPGGNPGAARGPAAPGRRRSLRRRSARRVGRHPLGRLPRWDGLGPRPEIHRRPAAAAAHRARPGQAGGARVVR